MKPEEIKRGMECCGADCKWDNGCPYGNFDKCTSVMIADALAYIQQLETQIPRWISATERLPNKGETVLFVVKATGVVQRGKYTTTGRGGAHWFTTRTGQNYAGGTYSAEWWMPLPKASKE